jgi:hypothetical protein
VFDAPEVVIVSLKRGFKKQANASTFFLTGCKIYGAPVMTSQPGSDSREFRFIYSLRFSLVIMAALREDTWRSGCRSIVATRLVVTTITHPTVPAEPEA